MFVLASIGDNIGANDIVGPSNAMYVDLAGNDATGQRGNAAQPFATVAAALAAQTTDLDEVLIGPGTFVVAAALTPNVGIKIFSVKGSGVQETSLTSALAVDVFDLALAGLTTVSMSDFTLRNTGTGQCIQATGPGAGFLSAGLRLERVTMIANAAATLALDFSFVGTALFLDCDITGSVSFQTCGQITWRGTRQAGTTALVTWASANAFAPASSLFSLLEASSMVAALSFSDQARFFGDRTALVTSMTGLNLSVVAGPVSPSFTYQGSVGTIDFRGGTAVLPDSALGAYTVDFSGCTILGASAEFETVATALTINMTGFVATAAAFVLTAGVQANILAKGSTIRHSNIAAMYATPDASGSITPPFLQARQLVTAAGTADFTWATAGYTGLVRVGTASWGGSVSANGTGTAAVLPNAQKAATGFRITALAIDTADVLITFP